ncbi:MAG: dnaN [Ilumatobacteraceae bacterium]|nr:dnaN [Ilumatobacteraceae bacterium]
MKFRCERETLAEALATAGRAATGRTGTLPVLSGLRLELVGDRLTVTGTDLDLTIQLEVAVGGEVDGGVVLPARLSSDIVRSLPAGKVEVSVDDDEVKISGGRSQFSVRPLSLDDYPRLTTPASSAVTLDAAAFGEALRQVVRAASTDEARPILTGVMLTAENDGLRLVATDSYRLAVRDLPGVSVLGADQKVLVPGRALNELQRVLGMGGELVLRLGERDATFEIGSTRLTTRLIEGEFPNYRQLIPASHPNTLTVDREPLLEAIRRVKILARDATPVRLQISADGLKLTAITQDVGNATEELDATAEGADLTVAFNPEYLAAGIEAVGADQITLSTIDALKPAVVRGVGRDDYLYLLMPVRVP